MKRCFGTKLLMAGISLVALSGCQLGRNGKLSLAQFRRRGAMD